MNNIILKTIPTILSCLLGWVTLRAISNMKNRDVGKFKNRISKLFVFVVVILCALLTVLSGIVAVSNFQDGEIGSAISLGVVTAILLASFIWYARELIAIHSTKNDDK